MNEVSEYYGESMAYGCSPNDYRTVKSKLAVAIGTKVRIKGGYKPSDGRGPPAHWGEVVDYDPDWAGAYEIYVAAWTCTILRDRNEFTVPRAKGGAA